MAESVAYVFPRLSGLIARDLYTQIADLSPAELTDRSGYRHSAAEFAPTGGAHVPEVVLRNVREQAVQLATRLGFPDTRSRDAAAQFDAECAALLHMSLPIIAAESARNDVWNFMTLVVVPDLARWRFPDAGAERFIGGVRNTFQRLWWRAQALRNDRIENPYTLLTELDEDTLVQIMERPGISANERLARALGYAAVQLANSVAPSKLENARRDAIKRVRQRMPVVCLEALSDDELASQILALFERAAADFSE